MFLVIGRILGWKGAYNLGFHKMEAKINYIEVQISPKKHFTVIFITSLLVKRYISPFTSDDTINA
jgi:hypothetical protein